MAPYLASWPQAARDEEDFNQGVITGRGLPEAVPLPDIPLAMITATRPDSSWLGGSPEASRYGWATIRRSLHSPPERCVFSLPIAK